jgi:hypothetical protein
MQNTFMKKVCKQKYIKKEEYVSLCLQNQKQSSYFARIIEYVSRGMSRCNSPRIPKSINVINHPRNDVVTNVGAGYLNGRHWW